MNNITITSKYNKNMIPCIIFGEYGWNFIFVDTKNNKCVKEDAVTMAWLKRNNITAREFTNHCWNEYNCMKDNGVTCGLISYFDKDDATLFDYSNSIDVANSYNTVFNF